MEALSHDLRTPLSRLKLASDFVEPPEMRTLVSDNVDELGDMLKSLSAWLRAQHEASTAEEVDLPGLVRQVLARWPDGAVRYEGPKTLTLQAHRGPLEQALIRLVDNAVRFGGRATVRLVDDADGRRLEVLDEGPGLSAENLARIYEPFFRGDAARARDTGGFGLGIPTAERLLKRFGGRLAIVNRPEGGLRACIWPPLATAE
jgi:signal transduction histidine kinase